jgi:hypothetical protein
MKQFSAQYNSVNVANEGLQTVSQLLDMQEKQQIDNLLWSDSGYKPRVSFAMTYTDSSILLKYYVHEKYTKADYREINDPVYKDSCVELFIAFNNEINYYNLEFNSLGTALVGYGTGKNDRASIENTLIKEIKSQSAAKVAGDEADGLNQWELTLIIPFTLFQHHHIASLAKQQCSVNLYKCGDDLPEPHFLSWNNIDYPEPDFHLPQFFGKVQFA